MGYTFFNNSDFEKFMAKSLTNSKYFFDSKPIVRPLVDRSKEWFFLMNTLQEYGVLKYTIQDKNGKTVFLSKKNKNDDTKLFYVITDFDKNKCTLLAAKIGHKNKKKAAHKKHGSTLRNTILTEGDKDISFNKTSFNNTLFYNKILSDFKYEKCKKADSHSHSITDCPGGSAADSRDGVEKSKPLEATSLKFPILANLDFDGPHIEVSFGGKVYEFSKNLRRGTTADILSVVAFSTGIGKRFRREDLAEQCIKTTINLVEVFKNNRFGYGANRVLAPLTALAPNAIKIMPQVLLKRFEAERIIEAADSVRVVDSEI